MRILSVITLALTLAACATLQNNDKQERVYAAGRVCSNWGFQVTYAHPDGRYRYQRKPDAGDARDREFRACMRAEVRRLLAEGQ
jgi:hypothetical protein